jgi:hypothetical protein
MIARWREYIERENDNDHEKETRQEGDKRSPPISKVFLYENTQAGENAGTPWLHAREIVSRVSFARFTSLVLFLCFHRETRDMNKTKGRFFFFQIPAKFPGNLVFGLVPPDFFCYFPGFSRAARALLGGVEKRPIPRIPPSFFITTEGLHSS